MCVSKMPVTHIISSLICYVCDGVGHISEHSLTFNLYCYFDKYYQFALECCLVLMTMSECCLVLMTMSQCGESQERRLYPQLRGFKMKVFPKPSCSFI